MQSEDVQGVFLSRCDIENWHELTKFAAGGSRVKDRLVNKICWIPWNM